MPKPEYRFVCHIVDQTNGDVVMSGSTYLSSISIHGECESVDMEVGSVLRAFRNKARSEYETSNYEQEEQN